MNIKPFIVPYVIFPFDVVVFLGHSEDQVKKWLERRVDLTDREKEVLTMKGLGRTVTLSSGQTVLWLKDKPKKGSDILAHEIFHAVHFLMVELSFDSDETFAYTIGYLTKKINEKL